MMKKGSGDPFKGFGGLIYIYIYAYIYGGLTADPCRDSIAVPINRGSLLKGSYRAPLKGLGMMHGRFRADRIIRTMWLFPSIGSPFRGCPCNKSLSTLGSILGPLIFANSHVASSRHRP